MDWHLEDAQNRFSELVNHALQEGSQRVRRRNEAVVVISAEENELLKGERVSFKKYLLLGESLEGLYLARDDSAKREIAL